MDRILGCVMAGAIADAIGYQVEFTGLDEILLLRPGGVTSPLTGIPLQISDDTQMSMFTMRGLWHGQQQMRTSGLSVDFDDIAVQETLLDHVRVELLAWERTQHTSPPGSDAPSDALERVDTLRRRRAPGNTCLQALAQGGTGTPEQPINWSKGCGAVMRSAPIGLLKDISLEAAYKLGCTTGALTHGHVDGWIPAGAMAALVAGICQGSSLRDAALRVQTMIPDDTDSSRLFAMAIMLATPPSALSQGHLEGRSMTDVLGTGWTGESALALGLYASLVGRDYADAIRIAATHDGDSDSTASIAGQLLGARDGVVIVPREWISQLDVSHVVYTECRRFNEHASTASTVSETSNSLEGRLDNQEISTRLSSLYSALMSMLPR